MEEDGSVRELTKDEKEYLNEDFEYNDGNRPYIKSNYWQKTPDNKKDGFLRRFHTPWWVTIEPAPKE